ncbi:MAG TPA: hypothetical protein VI894_02170 [Candidatus Nanoarchaeia archaeon]|nr:hypothetical protein [Candidatus Nanoarchaeia archaeon]
MVVEQNVFFAGFALISFMIGAQSLFLIVRANSKLSEGEIKSNFRRFYLVIAFLMLVALWNFIKNLLDLTAKWGVFAEYPEMLFIVGSLIAILYTSIKIADIGRTFGFTEEPEEG